MILLLYIDWWDDAGCSNLGALIFTKSNQNWANGSSDVVGRSRLKVLVTNHHFQRCMMYPAFKADVCLCLRRGISASSTTFFCLRNHHKNPHLGSKPPGSSVLDVMLSERLRGEQTYSDFEEAGIEIQMT